MEILRLKNRPGRRRDSFRCFFDGTIEFNRGVVVHRFARETFRERLTASNSIGSSVASSMIEEERRGFISLDVPFDDGTVASELISLPFVKFLFLSRTRFDSTDRDEKRDGILFLEADRSSFSIQPIQLSRINKEMTGRNYLLPGFEGNK